MNDFTKEELQTILELIIWGDDDPEPQSERIEEVKNKIQSLIDNYCEHEYEGKSVELHAKQCCNCQQVKIL